jgi:TolA-binding protein
MKHLATLFLFGAIYFSTQAQQLSSFTDNRRLYDDALELYDKNLFEAARFKFEQFIRKCKVLSSRKLLFFRK